MSGAWVTGVLDLEGCRIPRDIGLKDCHFEGVPVLRSAIIDNLFLDGCLLPGLQADRLEARGGLYFRGATIKGEIQLGGARFDGGLGGDGVTIDWRDDVAFNAEELEARGGVRLRGASIRGGVNLSGARLGGDLDCSAITLEQQNGDALTLNRAVIEGAFFLRQGASVRGALDLTATIIGSIEDEQACWPAKGDLLLNRCRYGAFTGGPVDAASRLNWLERQTPERWGEDFWPQPYEQLAAVFREMGHDEDSRAVLIAKERSQRRARRARAGNALWRVVLALKDGVLGITVRYGRQPLIAFLWLILFWALGVAIFGQAERKGAFKPNSPVVLRSMEWTMCAVAQMERRFMPSIEQSVLGRAKAGQTQLACFRDQPEAASYPEFNAWMYSLDTLLPVLEIGQKSYWRPDPSKPGGPFALNYFYVQALVGWALSLLAVAGFSGLVKSK